MKLWTVYSEYNPVKMVKEFDLKNLPSNEEFLESFKNPHRP